MWTLPIDRNQVFSAANERELTPEEIVYVPMSALVVLAAAPLMLQVRQSALAPFEVSLTAADEKRIKKNAEVARDEIDRREQTVLLAGGADGS